MGAQFGDRAVDDDADPVGVVRRVESVGDRHHCPSAKDRDEGSLEVARRPRIEHGGRLIQHERVRVAQHEARERQLLGLGRGDLVAGRAELGENPVGQEPHPFEGVDRVQRAHNLIVGGFGFR